MDITGTHSVPGARDRVFAALCDPAVLMRCIPVLEEMERLSPTDYAARVRTTVGPLKARFSGRLTLAPEDGIHRYRLIAQGMPQEFVDLATQKLALVNAAYDRIRREREGRAALL